MVYNYNFKISSEGKNYQFNLVAKSKNLQSGYKIVPQNDEDLPAIQKLFEDAKIETGEPLTAKQLAGRLKGLSNISQVDMKVANLFSAHFQQSAKLMFMVKNITSDADVRALCRECLAQNNNNPNLALNSLKNAFHQAGAGSVPVKISDMLINEASGKSVDDIKAFGKKGTGDVAQFLKTLPQTKTGAIDLTKMKQIGQGGNQVVYMLVEKEPKKGPPHRLEKYKEKPRPFVLKVNKESLGMTNSERLKKYKTDNAAYQVLHDCFGDHCTVEQLLLRDVNDETGTKKALISVADFETGFANKSKFALQHSDFAWNEVTVAKHVDAYDAMLESIFVTGKSLDLTTLKELNPNIAKLAELMEDPPFKKAVEKFLTLFKEYFDETGQYLDIAGKDNIIFFKVNDDWIFKLGTVIKRETAQKFEDALIWLHNGSPKTEESRYYRSILNYCFHWTKSLNTLAMMVGMDRVITDPNVITFWSDLEKAEITGKPSDPKRFLSILQAVEDHPAEELEAALKALDLNPEMEADCLLAILREAPPDKKLALAHYLHQELPRLPKDNKFCYVRFEIACNIDKIPKGKDLALECYGEVLKDPSPNAPHAEVLEAIQELSK